MGFREWRLCGSGVNLEGEVAFVDGVACVIACWNVINQNKK